MNGCSIMERTRVCVCVCTHTLAAGQPIFKGIHISSSCQSAATAGCLLLQLEQNVKTQRAAHLLPLPLRIQSLFLHHPPFALFFSSSFLLVHSGIFNSLNVSDSVCKCHVSHPLLFCHVTCTNGRAVRQACDCFSELLHLFLLVSVPYINEARVKHL